VESDTRQGIPYDHAGSRISKGNLSCELSHGQSRSVVPVYLNQPVHEEVRACICLRDTGPEKYGHRERVKEILYPIWSQKAHLLSGTRDT
jgi:hypothetical protein